jgi:hypothetical protein
VTTGTWKSKDGTVYRIADMDDAHLLASIRMLSRIRRKYRRRYKPGRYKPDPLYLKENELRAEAVRRGLGVPDVMTMAEDENDASRASW